MLAAGPGCPKVASSAPFWIGSQMLLQLGRRVVQILLSLTMF
jgi:hypothetical protein